MKNILQFIKKEDFNYDETDRTIEKICKILNENRNAKQEFQILQQSRQELKDDTPKSLDLPLERGYALAAKDNHKVAKLNSNSDLIILLNRLNKINPVVYENLVNLLKAGNNDDTKEIKKLKLLRNLNFSYTGVIFMTVLVSLLNFNLGAEDKKNINALGFIFNTSLSVLSVLRSKEAQYEVDKKKKNLSTRIGNALTEKYETDPQGDEVIEVFLTAKFPDIKNQ